MLFSSAQLSALVCCSPSRWQIFTWLGASSRRRLTGQQHRMDSHRSFGINSAASATRACHGFTTSLLSRWSPFFFVHEHQRVALCTKQRCFQSSECSSHRYNPGFSCFFFICNFCVHLADDFFILTVASCLLWYPINGLKLDFKTISKQIFSGDPACSHLCLWHWG